MKSEGPSPNQEVSRLADFVNSVCQSSISESFINLINYLERIVLLVLFLNNSFPT